MSMTSEPANEKERPILHQFRELVKNDLTRDKYESDVYLLRWLRARDLDVEKAALMLRTSLQWRKDNNVDKVLLEPISKEWCDVLDGCVGPIDKFGRPVVALPAGAWDLRRALDEGRKGELVRFLIMTLEILDLTMHTMWIHGFPNKTPQPNFKFTVILDLKEFTYGKFAHKKSVEALIEVVKIYEANYPETLGRAFIINSPRIFAMLFALVKPFMSELTVSKISIFDSNEKEYTKAILEVVDPEQLPLKYGGSRTDWYPFD